MAILGASNARPAAAVECPANEAIRVEQESAGLPELPDCRAYELVSPGSNPFVETNGEPESERASTTGEGIAYFSRYPAKNATRSGVYYLATRDAGGWSTEEIAPQDSPDASEETSCLQGLYFSAGLSRSILSDGWNSEEETPGETYCRRSEDTLVSGAPVGYGNLFLREGTSSAYQLINLTPEGMTPGNASLEDATADTQQILFGDNARLTPEAPSGYELYEWSGGTVHLVPILPEGTPVLGKLADGGSHGGAGGVYEGHFNALAPVTHAVSSNGERVFFYAEHESSINLYLRENATQPQSATSGGHCTEVGKACTIQVDVSHGSGTSGGGVFWDASEDGSRVFFADESKLTSESGAVAGKPDLYEYDVETGKLTDVTPSTGLEAANARGLAGASEDGSYVYFVAKGALTEGQKNANGATAQKQTPNLYLYHGRKLTFIATLNAESDRRDWQEELQGFHQMNTGVLRSRVAPSGEYFAFGSVNEITSFNNTDAVTGKHDNEIFLYDASTQELSCVSCEPDGAKPLGNTEFTEPMRFSFKPAGAPAYLTRNVLDDGRVFFTTPNALVPEDSNGVADVYEYEEGLARLLSSGTSPAGSTFYDASPNGMDAFFVTGEGLVRSDTDNNNSLYDARVDGGFAEPPLPPEVCEESEKCRPSGSEPPVLTAPSTASFLGPENQSSSQQAKGTSPRKCAKGRVRRHGKCVKPPKHRKKAPRNGKASSRTRHRGRVSANHGRGPASRSSKEASR